MAKDLLDVFLEIGERGNWPEHYESPEMLKDRIDCYASKLMNAYDTERVWKFKPYLENWLENEKNIKYKFLLINSLSFFTFFNAAQCKELFREALNGPIKRWLIDIKKCDILDSRLNKKLEESILHTCFSSATDSTETSVFRHVSGHKIDNPIIWRSFFTKEDTKKIKKDRIELCKNDLRHYNYEQIVVLEDFVGTGNQVKPVIDFLGNFHEWEILFVPLLICPQGDVTISKYLQKYNHISYEPMSVLPWELILADNRPQDKQELDPLLVAVKKYAERIHAKVVGTNNKRSPGYLGYKNAGALFAKHTNCPNNTLPLFYYNKNNKWNPLFPRSDR
jgi:hypothetical protein